MAVWEAVGKKTSGINFVTVVLFAKNNITTIPIHHLRALLLLVPPSASRYTKEIHSFH